MVDKSAKIDESLRVRALEIVKALKELYPDTACALRYSGEGWRLMVMARLSAQCTDARVNTVCKELFARYPAPEALADADSGEVEGIVRPCGLHRTKTADIIAEMKLLTDKYGGEVPKTMEELLEFPGVGRKIANLLLGDLYDIPGIVADTHCIRVSGRLGLTDGGKDPLKVERRLAAIIPPEEQTDFCHRLIDHGRRVCAARSPDCGGCELSGMCPKNGVEPKA